MNFSVPKKKLSYIQFDYLCLVFHSSFEKGQWWAPKQAEKGHWNESLNDYQTLAALRMLIHREFHHHPSHFFVCVCAGVGVVISFSTSKSGLFSCTILGNKGKISCLNLTLKFPLLFLVGTYSQQTWAFVCGQNACNYSWQLDSWVNRRRRAAKFLHGKKGPETIYLIPFPFACPDSDHGSLTGTFPCQFLKKKSPTSFLTRQISRHFSQTDIYIFNKHSSNSEAGSPVHTWSNSVL